VIDVDLNAVAVPLSWPALYGRDAPTEVEIGSGKGRFLLELAREHPEVNFLAVERAAKYHTLVCQRAAKRGLDNVRLLRTTAEDLLFRLLPPASTRALYVLFPDPWPKKRHHKRRLIQPDVVRRMLEVLEPGGRLLVKTDHPAYGEVIADVLGAVAGAARLDPDEAFRDLPLTGFERKYLDQGRPIRSFAVLRPSGS
jgi:tRNA (guanine-N7-)-methyltransferase